MSRGKKRGRKHRTASDPSSSRPVTSRGRGAPDPSSSATSGHIISPSPTPAGTPHDDMDDQSSPRFLHDTASVLPSSSTAVPDKYDYTSSNQERSAEFYEFLISTKDRYKWQLHGTTGMNKENGTSDPYVLHVTFEDMMKSTASTALIRDTCKNVKQNALYGWLIPAAKRFLRDNGCVNDSNVSCLSFTGFPESIQSLEEFLKTNGPLVKHVPVGTKKYILVPTVHGRLLIEMAMVAITGNHSQDISWGGEFSKENIRVIKWGSKRCLRNHGAYEMKIQQEPVKVKGWNLRTAMVRDLGKAAKIFIPFYGKDDRQLPVYFVELKKTLEKAQESFVAMEWFMEYLCHHVAFMPSIGRRDFVLLLNTIIGSGKLDKTPIMSGTGVYPNDWRQMVKKEDEILWDAYRYKNDPTVNKTDKFDNSVCGLIRLMRNCLEHGWQGRSIRHISNLELCAADKFPEFLPWLVRSLLQSGQMAKNFRVAWNQFMASKADKSDPWSN